MRAKRIVAIIISIMMIGSVFMPLHANNITASAVEKENYIEETDKKTYETADGQYSMKYVPYVDESTVTEKDGSNSINTQKSVTTYGSSTKQDFLNDCSTNFAFLDLNGRDNAANLQHLYNAILVGLVTYYEHDYDVRPVDFDGCEMYNFAIVDIAGLNISNEELLEVYLRVLYDHPLFFYASNEIAYNNVQLILTMDEAFVSGTERLDHISKVKTLVKNLAASADGATGNYEICKKVHDSILAKADYAWDGDIPANNVFVHNIVGVAKDGQVVCDGYSKTYSAVLNYLDIQSILVPGWSVAQGAETPDSAAHAWNIVQLGNKNYYFVDVTWDDESSDTTAFFCKGTSFYNTHSTQKNSDSNSFLLKYTKLPAISEEDYNGEKDSLYTVADPQFDEKKEVSFTYNSTTKTLTFSGDGVITGEENYENNEWYKYARKAEKLVIEDGITGVGTFAFYNFNKLKSIDFPDEMYTLGQQAFYGCTSLTSVDLPDGVEFFNGQLFGDCTSLHTVNFGELASTENELTACIGNIFDGCKKLKTITVPENHLIYSVKDGALFIDDVLVCYPAGLTQKAYTVPEGTHMIASRAFSSCENLEEVNLPNTLLEMAETVFIHCNKIKSVTIPESVLSIGSGVYSIDLYCEKLDTIINNSDAKLVLHSMLGFDTTGPYKGWRNAETGEIVSYINKGTAKAFHFGSAKSKGKRFKVKGVTYEVTKNPSNISVEQMLAGKSVATVKTVGYEPGFTAPKKGKTVKYDGWTYTVSSVATLKPSATSKVNASLYDYNDIKVSWNKSKNTYGYKVYYAKGNSSKYKYAGSTTGHSLKIANLSSGKKYTFKIVSYIKINGKTYSKTSTKKASLYTLKKLASPKVKKASSSKVKITWKNIEGETGYQISKSDIRNGTTVIATYKTTKGTSKTISAKKGTKYYYKVRAYKTVGSSKVYAPWSSVKAFKVK